MAEYNVKDLKSGGFMKQKEKDLFSVRLRLAGGYLEAEQLPKLAEISRKYGRGHIHLSTRQGIEIPYVQFDDFEKLRSDLADAGLQVASLFFPEGTCLDIGTPEDLLKAVQKEVAMVAT